MYLEIAENLAAFYYCTIEQPKVLHYQHCLIQPGFAFHTAAIDVVGPLPLTASKNKFIIVAVDQLTKWVEEKAIPNPLALITAKFII